MPLKFRKYWPYLLHIKYSSTLHVPYMLINSILTAWCNHERFLLSCNHSIFIFLYYLLFLLFCREQHKRAATTVALVYLICVKRIKLINIVIWKLLIKIRMQRHASPRDFRVILWGFKQIYLCKKFKKRKNLT